MNKRSELNVDSIDMAFRYLSLGFRPIPIVAGTKCAAIKWKHWQTASPGEQELTDWFSVGERDIALVTGNGVVVVDVDDPSLLELVIARCGDTPMRCRTPSGGMHLYYAMRSGIRYGNAVRINGMPIDLRCEGAYIVCPWSRNADGVPYEWVGELIHADDLPPLRISWLRERGPRRLVTPVMPPTNAENAAWRARGYLAHVEGAIAGMRGHDRTFRVACVLTIKFGLTMEQAWPLFLEWNEQCEPPWSEKELLHKLQDAINQRFVSRKEGV
jgi:hypothetical protein